MDLGLAQVDLVTAHDRDRVDAADSAEPAAPVRAAHDRDHPAHRLAGLGHWSGPGCLAGLLRQVAGQGGQVAAGLGGERLAGPVLELVQGEPADGGLLAERPDGRVTLGIRDAHRVVAFGHLSAPNRIGVPR